MRTLSKDARKLLLNFVAIFSTTFIFFVWVASLPTKDFVEESITAATATTIIPTTTPIVTINPTEMSAAQIQAQITALLAQIVVLQNQLSVTQSNVSYDVNMCNFSRDLTVGDRGDDVACLQAYLIATLPTYKGVGWPKDLAVTGYFDRITQGALATWQAYHGLVPADGYFDMGSMVIYSHLTRVPKG